MARGLLGQLGKDNPARVTTLFIAPLGKTYMVRKRTSSYHKTQSCLFVAHQAPPNLLKDSCQVRGGKYLTIACGHHRYFSPSASQDVGFRETAFHFTGVREAPH